MVTVETQQPTDLSGLVVVVYGQVPFLVIMFITDSTLVLLCLQQLCVLCQCDTVCLDEVFVASVVHLILCHSDRDDFLYSFGVVDLRQRR